MSILKRNLICSFLLAVFLSVRSAPAVDLYPGDVLVTAAGNHAVLLVDLNSQTVDVVARGLTYPKGIALGPRNEIYVLDAGSSNERASVVQIDRSTGNLNHIVSLGQYDYPSGITVGTGGQIYVSGLTRSPRQQDRPWVVAVDAATGDVSQPLNFGTMLRSPRGMTIGPWGGALVADPLAFNGRGGVIDIYGILEVASAGYFLGPLDVAVEPNGLIAVLDPLAYTRPIAGDRREAAPSIISVDPQLPAHWECREGFSCRNNQSVITFDGYLYPYPANPTAIASDLNGDLLVVQERMIIRVDPSAEHFDVGANQDIAFEEKEPGDLVDPTDMVVVPGVEPGIRFPWEPPSWWGKYEDLLREGAKSAK